MPDPLPQSSADPVSRAPSGNGDVLPDPLAGLHPMSRTAGLGAQDYVAINPVAVTALLLGLASSLALVAGMLLIIPVAGIICAIVGLWQIRHSNGTQTGRALAWSGLGLCLVFTGLVGARQIAIDIRDRADRDAVMQTVVEFGSKLASEDFAVAYDMLGPSFRQRLPKDEFLAEMKLRSEHPLHGKVVSMQSNGRIAFENYENTRNSFATTQVVVQLEHRGEDRQQMGLQKVGDKWEILGFGWWPPRLEAPPQRSR